MTHCCDLSSHPRPKQSPISADNSWDKKWPDLYVLAHIHSGALLLCHSSSISYHGDIESRMLQIRIRKDSNGECRYDRSYTKRIKYVKKPNRMLGFFIAYIFFRSDLDVHLECELKSPLGQWDNVALVPSSVAFSH